MEYLVFITAAALCLLALFYPQLRWPKWLAYISLTLGVFFGGSELIHPDPVIGGRPTQETLLIAGLVAVVWCLPAIGYGMGRFLRWVFIGPTAVLSAGRKEKEHGKNIFDNL